MLTWPAAVDKNLTPRPRPEPCPIISSYFSLFIFSKNVRGLSSSDSRLLRIALTRRTIRIAKSNRIFKHRHGSMHQSGRSPVSANHLEIIDLLRGVAILAVFLFHCLGASFGFSQLPWNGLFPGLKVSATFFALLPCSYGWAGVALFFVISGFCIHLSHIRSGEKGFGRFFVRRFFRIYPAYLVCVLAFFFIPPWKSDRWMEFRRCSTTRQPSSTPSKYQQPLPIRNKPVFLEHRRRGATLCALPSPFGNDFPARVEENPFDSNRARAFTTQFRGGVSDIYRTKQSYLGIT